MPTVATPVGAAQEATAPLGPSAGAQDLGNGLTILLDARELCWIRATVDGKRTLERLVQRGERATFHARREVVLRTGNAGAVSLTINGLVAKPLGRQGEVATTQITAANYKRLTF